MFDKGKELTVKHIANKPVKSYIYIGKAEEGTALEIAGKSTELIRLLPVVIENLAKSFIKAGISAENVIDTFASATAAAVTHAMQEAKDEQE